LAQARESAPAVLDEIKHGLGEVAWRDEARVLV
jgi:hypothetical protein